MTLPLRLSVLRADFIVIVIIYTRRASLPSLPFIFSTLLSPSVEPQDAGVIHFF
jgi:hypothetical protein